MLNEITEYTSLNRLFNLVYFDVKYVVLKFIPLHFCVSMNIFQDKLVFNVCKFFLLFFLGTKFGYDYTRFSGSFTLNIKELV